MGEKFYTQIKRDELAGEIKATRKERDEERIQENQKKQERDVAARKFGNRLKRMAGMDDKSK